MGSGALSLSQARFLDIRYSTLVQIADRADWSKKSYNNAISVLRRAFKFGYRDHPEQHDPTRQLKGARIQRKDRPVIDPFTVEEAETLIATLRRDWAMRRRTTTSFDSSLACDPRSRSHFGSRISTQSTGRWMSPRRGSIARRRTRPRWARIDASCCVHAPSQC
jgi:integrase